MVIEVIATDVMGSVLVMVIVVISSSGASGGSNIGSVVIHMRLPQPMSTAKAAVPTTVFTATTKATEPP